MVRLSEESSNRLFATLAEWDAVLQAQEIE